MLKLSARREKLWSPEFLTKTDNYRTLRKIPTSENPLTLDAALLICQELHICLIAKGDKLKIWHPGVVVPRRVTQVIRTNQREVLRRIGQAHVSVCPSPELHAHSWHYTVKRDCCDLCARLNHWMDKCA